MSTINTQNLETLIKTIEKAPDERFNMGRWMERKGCGTVACIAGWAWLAVGKAPPPTYDIDLIEGNARSWLGLDTDTADKLFYGVTLDGDQVINDIDKAVALDCLRHLANTGVVDWSRSLEREGEGRL